MSEQSDPRRILLDQEAVFLDEELFFSRTDPHGVIQEGNDVFRRVSGYGWDELRGKPHKIIRHPDTPRAVFWLLWDAIARGQPIGAYVKNRAKDGAYYWVFAIVTPEEDGYLSVRLKPGSAIFAAARDLYAVAVRREAEERLEPAQSAELLLADLRAAGFESYSSFMTAALAAELGDRDRRLAREPARPLVLLEEVATATASLLGAAKEITEAYEQNRYMPLNFRVLSAQLGNAGAAIGSISANYSECISELQDNLASFSGSAQQVWAAVLQSQFLIGVAHVQTEMCDIFRGERAAHEGEGHEDEVGRLERQSAGYEAMAVRSLQSILSQVERFRADCNEMTRLAASLEVTRIMGEVECATLPAAAAGLRGLLEELGGFQKVLANSLRELGNANAQIADLAQRASRLTARPDTAVRAA